jgi:hypothetical protein
VRRELIAPLLGSHELFGLFEGAGAFESGSAGLGSSSPQRYRRDSADWLPCP